MKHVLSLILLASSVLTSSYSLAQQSCSFIIHVDGQSGTDNATCGEEGTPCASINYGIDRAVIEGYSDVRVAANQTYNEIIELEDGINIWGGFDAQWATTGLTVIEGGLAGNGEYYTLVANTINSPTVLSDLEIIAPDALTAGKSSYGIHVTNSTGLMLQRVTVQGGSGSQGTNGVLGTDATVAGINGANGGDSDEFNTACNDNDSGDGGAGAVTPGYPNTGGGNGGRGGYMDADCSGFPDLDATPGIAGSNAVVFVANSYGYRGGGGSTCNAGVNGNNGQTVHGTGGAGATTAATLTGSFWTATVAASGTLGQNGTGGGGGGGSGGCDSGTDSYGAGGGGGGSGGIAAPAVGTGGQSGGNSAAVFMLTSTCSFVDCSFFLGSGGIAGSGGKGGLGTEGGDGGIGGAGFGTGAGGSGGNGGDGGNSGGGGGGAGGSTYGIYAENSTINQSGSSFSGGSTGSLGTGGLASPGPVAGTDGAGGVILEIGGNATNNTGVLALEEDPCTEITTVDLSTLEFCAGESTTVDYNAVGSFSGNNTFTAELSDGAGDFGSPVAIGSIVSSSSGTISVTFPANTPSGTGYRIRVTATATPAIGIETPTDIVINGLPTVVANASATTVCSGSEVTLTGGGADLYTWNNGVFDDVAFVPNQTQYYNVVGVDANTLCANIDSVEVTVVDLPDTSVVQNGNQLAAVLSGATYRWLDCDDGYSFITGEDQQTFLTSNSGNFAVEVTLNGCTDTSSCYNVFVVGLEQEMEKENVLLLYPNPSNGIFQMISDVEAPMEVTVFNAMGQMMLTTGNVTANTSIDLRGLNNGLYSIRFYNNDLNILRQVIIQK
jgi:hypothetical protein